MNLTNCPYDGERIEAEYSGGSFLLSCAHCGAEWEMHSNIVRRVQDPDWSVVGEARTAVVDIDDPSRDPDRTAG